MVIIVVLVVLPCKKLPPELMGRHWRCFQFEALLNNMNKIIKMGASMAIDFVAAQVLCILGTG